MDKLTAFAVLTGAARVGAAELKQQSHSGIGNPSIIGEVEAAIETLKVAILGETPQQIVDKSLGENVTRLF